MFTRILPALALCAAGLATSASASTVTLNYTGSGPFGSENLAQRADISYTGGPAVAYNNLYAGPFQMTDGVDAFAAWCFDIFQYVGNGVSYTVTPGAIDPARETLLSRLFTSAFDQVTTAQAGAAFQLAIWEIVYEDADSPLSLAAGDFRASDNAGAIALASSWLSNLGTEARYSFTYYLSGTNQDLLRGVAPVPLPAGIVLLLGGLGALGALRRRAAARA